MTSKHATVRDLRRTNRATVLSRLYFDGPLSRFELSGITGLSAATVSNVTAELVRERLVVEAGQVESDGGRPRVLLRVDPGYAMVAGVDIGETGVKAELFDLAMNRLAAVDLPLPSKRGNSKQAEPAAVVAQAAAGLREVLAGVDEDKVLGVGVGVPGTVEQEPVRVHAQTIGWHDVPLADLLCEAGVSVPVFVENGAKTQGQAEMWFGAGRGARHAVILLIGSGVGASVITDGTIYRGSASSAGEWGHTIIQYGGRRCRCGASGCLEAYVGGEAIVERYRAVRRGKAVAGADEQANLATLLVAAEKSKTAARVLDEAADHLGAGIANLVNLFNPERIVLGGWAGLAIGARLLPRITEAVRTQALRRPFEQLTIELGKLGPDAVAVGAATLPVAALLDQRGTR
ncbi:ROK family protein [Labedaea rhizosphaerae]|uniref:Putative NBD/HSP70 family sugar kinase n=1 Tax=Labedaea rhizosphaerae TaxID=598644 RepID=A0A4R6SI41_LABRH|nr:ROK family protein [Labedaea rhizosphaerae]TDQ01484.1 putative NBD/HSP70 family sugar kinase [Labedaea rhizosphaerae]